MPQYLAIVAYRCIIAGSRRRRLDIQVQWYDAPDESAVRASIADEPIQSYENSDGEIVSWERSEVLAVEPFSPKHSGDEVVGFIASIRELKGLV
ncbi:MAG: hypothetical protein ABI353_17725 [Isosphaeraceae bacterium]